MIEETGQVVDVRDGFAWIEHERTSTCGSCAVRRGCGTSAIAKVLGQRRVRLRVVNRIDARVGDQVVVGIDEQGLLRGSLAVYAVPLLTLFAGALAGQWLGQQAGLAGEAAAVAGAVAGLAGGLLWLARFSRRRAQDADYQPVVLRRITTPGTTQGGFDVAIPLPRDH